MRCLLRNVLLLTALCFTGCFPDDVSSTKSTYTSTTISTSLSYEDFSNRHLLWSNIFSIDVSSYYVYFYSKTCSHCNNLKEYIFEVANKRKEIYFVQASEEIVFIKDVSQTIGADSIEDFGIIGYPTLIKIENKIVVKNLAGISLIRSELSIE